MNKKNITISSIIIGILFLQGIYFLNIIPKANSEIIIKTQNSVPLNNEYTYNVTQFDSHFSWILLNFTSTNQTAFTNPGGQIKVNFTKFDVKDPDDFTVFSEPLPYINIKMFINESNNLVLNISLNSIPNSEASFNLAIGFNSFFSGFLIPIDNLTELKMQANEQASSTAFVPGTIDIKETSNTIKFTFKATDKSQNSTMKYNKTSGLLLWAKVENIYGPDLEIILSTYFLEEAIPGYDMLILTSVIFGSISIIYVFNKKKIRIHSKIKKLKK